MDENEVIREEGALDGDIEESVDFDDGWDDDSESSDEDFDLSEPTDNPVEEVEEPAEEPTEEPAEEPEQDSAEPVEEEEGSQLYTINYLGNEEKLTWDQVKELAEKGRNYDHVKEERDSLRGDKEKYKDADRYAAFLQELADKSGLTIDEQIDRTHALWLMNEEADKGNDISEADALLRVQRNRTAKQQEETKPEEPDPEETANQAAIQRFVAVYPDLKAEDIPQEVWDEANKVKDILGPYQKYLISKLQTENSQLKQNEKNKERSTGSRKTAGASAKPDSFDEGWDS